MAPNPAKAPTREATRQPLPRDAPRDRLTGTHREYKAKGSWPGAAANQSVFQYWNIDPALAAILRHIETEWKADRESARGAGVQRERERARERGGGARAKHGAERIERRGRARNGVIERTPTLRYWIGLLKTIIESVLNKRQKNAGWSFRVQSSSPWRRSGRGCWIRFHPVKEESLYGYWFFIITVDRY